ncbi:MAG: glycosyltransferase family 32 protein [bacterium]
MIPRKIHYCWFGLNEMPLEAKDCIASWHKYMPDWEYKLWSENNFDIECMPYTAEAYASGKMAFVSDVARLKALHDEGGVYLDTDVEVFQSLDPLLTRKAFAGFEGSKHKPVGTCVMASEAGGKWVTEMLEAYKDRHFLSLDGTLDLTTNVQFITTVMAKNGFRQDGIEQDYKDLHIFPVDYFSPRHTTGEYIRTENTYCEHKGLSSWSNHKKGWKGVVLKLVGQKNMTRLIKLKRHFENLKQN